MSNLTFYEDPEDIPQPMPREDVRFESVQTEPYPDGRRVKLTFKLKPFIERPSVEAWVTNASGHMVATLSLIEAMDQEFDFTVHLRGPQPTGLHTLHLELFYVADVEKPDEKQIVDTQAVEFTV
ncbi:MAG: hypothetical protein JNL09_08020 [Anaerolineales bacterium]|nr:hypothetical protein [Anaerolineales bacterium]